VPRVRNVAVRQEVPWESYQAFRKTKVLDHQILNRLICGISQRQYEQAAYQQPSYEKAKEALERIAKELRLINGSAVESLREGLEETLTLHRLGLFEELGTSFKTTNCLENVNRQLERLTHRVSYWKNSDQRQRWTATALLEIEPWLRKVKGFRHLKAFRKAMKKENHPKSDLAAA
jgi:putative transposase